MNKKIKHFRKVAAVFLCLTILSSVLCVPNSATASAVATNLVYNGDGELSETEATGWAMISMENTNESSEAAGKTNRYDKEFTLSAASGEGVDGSNALKAAKKSSYGYAAMVSDPVAINSGADYTLSYAYKMTDIAFSSSAGFVLALRVLVEQYDANGNCLVTTRQGALISNSAGKITEDIQQWQNISTGFTAAEGAATCRIYFFMGGMSAKVSFNAWFDNISVVEQAADQLDNGEFEAVMYNGSGNTGADYKLPRPVFWNSITTRDTGVPRTDINSLAYYGMVQVNDGEGHETAAKIYVANASGGFGGVTYYSNPVNVYAEEEYEIKFDLKIAGVLPEDVSNSYGANVMIRYLDASGNYIGNPFRINSINKNNQDWTSYAYTFTIPEGVAQMQIGMMIGVGTRNRNKDMAYYFDHLQLIRLESLKDPAVTSSELYKKKALFLGDEIGGGLAQFAGSYSEMRVTDNTVAAAGFSDLVNHKISQQAMPAAAELDYVFVTGGLFDRLQDVPAGKVNAATDVIEGGDTYAGALEAMFMNLAMQYDGLKVAYIFPYDAADLSAYREVAQAAAEKWKICFVDLYSDTKVNEEVLEVTKDTYLTAGKLPTTEGCQRLWKYLIDTLEQVPVMDASQIPGLSEELLLTARYNGIVGAGITPATDADSLKALGQKVAENGTLPELAEKIAANLARYEAYRPQILGATIAVGDANKLRFLALSPESELGENVKITGQGFLVAPQSQVGKNKAPTLETAGVMALTAPYTEAGARYGSYISGMKVDPMQKYAAVAYTLYEVNEIQYLMCSTNDYENQLGVKVAENGVCVKSVYEIAKTMALYLAEQNEAELDWSILGGVENKDKIATATEKTKPTIQNVFLFTGKNQEIMQKLMEKEENTNE